LIFVDKINALRKKFGGTVNDIFLGLLSGAMRTYAQELGATHIPKAWTVVVGNTRYLVPGSEKASFLDIYVGGMILRLPTDVADPVRFCFVIRL
jgi:hypothetical protein